MDNLTHSLIGAVLGQAGLKRKTGLAMPALILAANLPDIDAPCAIYGVASLSMRRGITHGPIALLLLPLVLAGVLMAFDRWQERRGKRPSGRLPVHRGWLVALCYIGTLTHPAFDWLNNYGIRLLEPFSSRWLYGDALFIIDPWVLAMLGGGIWLSLRRERAGAGAWTKPARLAVAGVLAFVALNIGISRLTAGTVRLHAPYPAMTVANAVPLAFWRREVLWRGGDGTYGSVSCSWLRCAPWRGEARPIGMANPLIKQRAGSDPALRAFLFWSRMPVAEGDGGALVLRDQRFMDERVRSNFSVRLER